MSWRGYDTASARQRRAHSLDCPHQAHLATLDLDLNTSTPLDAAQAQQAPSPPWMVARPPLASHDPARGGPCAGDLQDLATPTHFKAGDYIILGAHASDPRVLRVLNTRHLWLVWAGFPAAICFGLALDTLEI